MHNNFTLYARRIAMMVIFAFFGLILSTVDGNAQSYGGGTYGNSWLAGKYAQPWVRIGVNQKGIQRVAIDKLPDDFKNADKTKLALWHRGNQVSIISATSTEILFYGVPNDGASDVFLYRPQSSRKNPYYSIYSDESAYFLTVNPVDNGARAITPTVTPNGGISVTSHVKTDLKKYTNEYTHSTENFYRPATLNSYFEQGKQTSGTALMNSLYGSVVFTSNPKSLIYSSPYVPEPFSFQFVNPSAGGAKKINVHLKGRLGSSTGDIYVGKTAGTLRKVATVQFTEMLDTDLVIDLQSDDYDAAGVGTLGFSSPVSAPDGRAYSVSYFTVVYDQTLDMQGLNSYEFEFPAASGQSNISIANAPTGVAVYDITNPDVPKKISGNPNALVIDRNGSSIKLLATNESVEIIKEKISTVTFTNINPADFDYLIVSSGSLNASANEYGNYRRTGSPGKKYKPLVTNIKDIYNQFNYGEPSPLAIRRYVDYMISDNNKNKFLLLIGISTTYYESMVREIPDEVPTIGFPGSDLLIVDGLAGTSEDVPAIPVGRIAAISDSQVREYLGKVSKYEAEFGDLSWRKNVMHISGGKNPGEVTLFSNYMSTIATSVTNTPFAGTVLPKIKSDARDVIENINIGTELTAGLGMISYFGHGNYNATDYNAGYAYNVSNYANPNNRFPVMFYNGCGVNNIFIGLNDLEGVNKRTLSLDWLLSTNGAIVVFGNTWDAYASNSNEYLDLLYPKIFSQTDTQRKTIGQILQDVAQQVKTLKGYSYSAAGLYNADRANIHQILLQGDPAMRILLSQGPLPVKLISFNAESEQDKVVLKWKTASEVNNGRFEIERSYNAKNFEKLGNIEGKGTTNTETSYFFNDITPLSGDSYYRLKQIDRVLSANGQYVDGQITYSKIVSVTRDASNFLVISPNPTSDFVDIKLNASVEIKSWELIDTRGIIRNSGKASQTVNLVNLESGEYIIRITTQNGDLYNKKVVRK